MRGAALDVGYGEGRLVRRLAPHVGQVTGIDTDPAIIDAARARGVPANAAFRVGGLAEVRGRFDVVTMVAVLHHLRAREALEQVVGLLNPGGRFLCVGLARVDGAVDLAWDVLNAATNPVIGVLKHPRVNRGAIAEPAFRTVEPTLALDELRTVGAEVMPGLRVRRRQGFRHTLKWTRPG
ncbi:class I SAM-dependent methyltransferase [Corynebacterium halotolerans]|uniref:class I SAM-dependent methyltransferase n=1 Tax=Corynebacterium halotolerans TaxID=225326 RepID=UPI000A58EE10|nr:class I SAM-dependent methyltransferase [Corynebacterium halotolerans]